MKAVIRTYILFCLLASVAAAQPSLTIKRARVVNWPTVEVFYQIKCIGQMNITHTAADLTVAEDGLPVSSFSVYSPDTTQHSPMSVAMVFDASGGTGGGNNPSMKLAGSNFINKMNGTTDEAALVFYNSLVILQQSMTTSKSTLLNQLSTLGFVGNRAMIDGTHAGIIHTASIGQHGNKAVVLISDGFDNASSYTTQDVIDLARTYSVRIYTVGLGASYDINAMKMLADSTGGAFYNVPDTAQLKYTYSEIFEHISDEGRESRLTYTTSCRDGGAHQVAIEIPNLCSGTDRKTYAFIKPFDPSDRGVIDLQITNAEAMAGTFINVPITILNAPQGVLHPMAIGFTFPKSVLQLQDVEITGSSPLLNTTISVIPVGNDYVVRTHDAVPINGPGVILALKFFVLDRPDSVSCQITQTGAWVSSGCLYPALFSGQVNVAIPPRPVIEAIGPTGVCPGDSVVLRLTNAYDRYEWTTGDSTRTIVVRAGGNVAVAVTDHAGRTGQSPPFPVTVFDAPSPKLSTSGMVSLCAGSTLPLTVSGNFTAYQWSNGGTLPTLNVDTAGLYFVEVIDTNGCHGRSDTVMVILDDPVVTIDADGPLTFCEGDTLRLRASDGFTSWRWSNGGATQELAVTHSDRLTVRAVNAAGCIAQSDTLDVVVLPRPVAIITSDKSFTLCPDDSLTLDAQAGHDAYLWSTGSTSRRISVRRPGTYWVKVAGPNGCYSAPATVQIGTPVRPVLQPGGAQVACYGEVVRVDAGSGFIAYRWNTGDTTRFADIRLTGDYWVDATEPGGCIMRSDTVVVQIRPRIEPVITIDGSQNLCEGDSVVLSAPIGYVSYYWNTGETSSRIVVRDRGDYHVTVYDNENCSGTSGDIPVELHARPAKPTFTRQDAMLVAPLATAYQWYRNGLSIQNATSRSYTVLSNGWYSVEVFNEYGCGTLSDEQQVNVTAVEKLPAGFALEIYPDPTDGMVNVRIETPDAGELRMDVMNMLGQSVALYQTRGGTTARHIFDLRHVLAGMYILRVDTGTRILVRRFVKR
ncbi:MAG: VWA domain-containing protein [Bacteroidetes bacterium]|nr:VWA domain-containing protein [Bacteroidota bacterium]